MDKQTDEETLKTCWFIICFSVGSHRGQKQPRNAVFEQALRTDRRTDGRTDRPSYRDAFLTDASKNGDMLSSMFTTCDFAISFDSKMIKMTHELNQILKYMSQTFFS